VSTAILDPMKNTIPDRVFTFLKKYPPFSLLNDKDLEALSENVVIHFLQKDEYIFKEGTIPQDHIYMVREGAIQLLQEEENILVEECDEGDLFGIRPLIAQQAYVLSAKAMEETLVYAIQTDNLKTLIESNPKLAYYLAQNFAVDIGSKYSKLYKGRLFLEKDLKSNQAISLFEIQSIQHSKVPVTCPQDTPIQQAAIIMRDHKVGSILMVNENFYPTGILTDRDLRNQVVTGQKDLDASVSEIMNHPVITVEPERTVADIQILMMKHRIHHLCITEDGSDQSKVLGIISQHDLLVMQGNNPAIFIREMQRSKNAEELRIIREKAEDLLEQYLQQEVAISFIANMMTEINDALIVRIIQFSLKEMEQEGEQMLVTAWCWMGLGSEGRGEQLLRTDQDNALVFEDVPDEMLESTRQYFLKLSKKITNQLNVCGFEYCPGDMMASNPKWCLSLSEWKNQFSEWISKPTNQNIMHCNIFFDYRPLYGDDSLTEALTDHIFSLLGKESLFMSLMAKNSLGNPPPLTFFRNFVVEKDGEHKNDFDIKSRAMMPLTDAARILTLNNQLTKVTNTFERFEKLAEVEPNNQELYEQAADAYEILMRYRALEGLKNKDSGRYLNPAELAKMERLNLRNSFRPIEKLQDILKVRFRLAYFG